MQQATVFTDGASRGNPGPGGWGAIISFDAVVRELGGSSPRTTNNRMELTAVLEALCALPDIATNVVVCTDSSYVIQGATGWIHGWQKNGWITKTGSPVLNKELWEPLAVVLKTKQVAWQHVGGHVGIPGNERVDAIATSFADGSPVHLYEGGAGGYVVDLSLREGETLLSDKKDRSKQKAHSYLSYVNGVVARHKTWASCEARVRGISAAKYRKALSADDERDIVTSWGASPDDIADAE
ncbi:MAG: hypothetical protein RL150_494 [Candidatus Parcubacteria bacterium]|jgi:ribonuclease HI